MVVGYTKPDLQAMVAKFANPEQVRETINRWLSRGDGVAVYSNRELGHPGQGNLQLLSYGSAAAQFEDEPPDRLPDFPGAINWRYWLDGVYRGEPL